MTELFGIPLPALLGQLLLGLVNGSFYALLSLGLAVIFGMLNIINFAHGALYMIGAFLAWMGMPKMSIGSRCFCQTLISRCRTCSRPSWSTAPRP